MMSGDMSRNQRVALTRRSFLKAAGSGVGALALAGNNAFGQPPIARSSEIVVIGAGAFGGWTALQIGRAHV